MKRNRIVIDFNKPQARGGKSAGSSAQAVRRVFMVIAAVLIVIVVAVVVAGFIWWRSYRSTPAYSLAVLTDAAQREDVATADTVLDSDKVTDDFVSQVRQRTAGSYSTTISSLLGNQTSSVPALTAKLRQNVHDQVIREVQRITEPAAGKPFIVIALVTPRFVQFEQENDTARALVNIRDEHVRLTMQRVENRWRVVAVQDDHLAQLIADSIRRDLSTSGSQVEDEIKKHVDKLQNK